MQKGNILFPYEYLQAKQHGIKTYKRKTVQVPGKIVKNTLDMGSFSFSSQFMTVEADVGGKQQRGNTANAFAQVRNIVKTPAVMTVI